MPTIGPIQITWFTGKAPTVSSPSAVVSETPPSDPADVTMKDDAAPQLRSSGLIVPQSPHPQEEEVIASGWGEDGDGEDGMGML